MEIKLEFCVVWNYTPRAVGTIEDILEVYGNKVTNIQLIPSGGGVFEFHLNEKLLFSKKEPAPAIKTISPTEIDRYFSDKFNNNKSPIGPPINRPRISGLTLDKSTSSFSR